MISVLHLCQNPGEYLWPNLGFYFKKNVTEKTETPTFSCPCHPKHRKLLITEMMMCFQSTKQMISKEQLKHYRSVLILVLSPSGKADRSILSKCNICHENPCHHGGVCHLMDFKNFTCECSPGYHGRKCDQEINACFGNPCMNTGRCEVLENGRFQYVLYTIFTVKFTNSLNLILSMQVNQKACT